MNTISDPDITGIEAELHSYGIKTELKNGVVLAESNIEGELQLPCLKIVSEGAKVGSRYLELVFGPVKNSDLRTVGEVIKIAKEVNTKHNKCDLEDWVNVFNNKISKKYRKFSLVVKTRSELEKGKSKKCSIQANVLTPLKYFANVTNIEKMLEGSRRYDYHMNIVMKKLSIKTLPPNLAGVLLLTVFLNVMYSESGYFFNPKENKRGIVKQLFYVLPKIELVGFLGELFNCNFVNKDDFIEKISALKYGSRVTREKIFDDNIKFLIDCLSGRENGKIAPNPEGVLPVYNKDGMVYLVLEYRKEELVKLRNIVGSMGL